MEKRRLDREATWKYISAEWTEVREGTRWRCIRCSDCCRKEWTINLTWREFDRLRADPRVKVLPEVGLETDPCSGLDHPFLKLNGGCPMLSKEGAACMLHPDWPYTCAVYPFLLLPDGRLVAHVECKGFGHGEPLDLAELKARIIRERVKAGMAVDR